MLAWWIGIAPSLHDLWRSNVLGSQSGNVLYIILSVQHCSPCIQKWKVFLVLRFLNLPFNPPGYRILALWERFTSVDPFMSSPETPGKRYIPAGSHIRINGIGPGIDFFRETFGVWLVDISKFDWLVGWLVGVLWLIERISNISLPAILVFIDIHW